MHKLYFLTLLVFSFVQFTKAQETVITIKLDGKLTGKDFVQTSFGSQGYQSTEIKAGQLKDTLQKPTQLSFLHLKGNGKIVSRRNFWIGSGNYAITGSIEDLNTLKIDREHEYTIISRQIQEAEGDTKKRLILQNLDKEVGVLWLVSQKNLFDSEEINEAVETMPEEMSEMNFFKRFLAESKLQDNGQIKANENSKDFSLESREGPQVSLSDFDGKYRLLEFSFSGCKPCIEALPEIKEIHENFGESLEVISIWNDSSKEIWLNSSKKYKDMITWTDLWDEAGFVTKLYQVNVWPTYILISPEGTIEQIWNSYNKGRILRKMESLFALPTPD